MPEAAVHKDRDSPAREHDVGPSWQLPGVEPKAVSHPVQKPANGHLGAGVPAPDTRHEGAALLTAHDIEPRSPLASARNPW